MKIYIKDYLRKLPILDELCKLIISYSNNYKEDDFDNYDDFKDNQLTDDVTRFLDYVVPNIEDLRIKYPEESNLEELRKNHIIYLTNLFYSVKGTYKVLDYLTEYDIFQTSLGKLEQEKDTSTVINYTTQGIEVIIDNLPSSLDRDLFCRYFEKFLNNLLYFETLTINIKRINVGFKDTTSASINHGDLYYQLYKTTTN